MREETNMRHNRQSIILGTAFFATIALWPGTQASAVPSSATYAAPAAIAADPTLYKPPDRSPYQEGYEKGLSSGEREGSAQARSHCADTTSWPKWPEGAYGVGYAAGYQLGWNKGLHDGMVKHCRPA
jgi:flagellar biosynthesis/type III secretory pathway protein FliH